MKTLINWQDVSLGYNSLDLSDMGRPAQIIAGTYQIDYDAPSRVPDDFIINVARDPLWFHKQGLMQTATGYGEKLVTEYVINCADKRKRRVYCSCFSNVGSLYILIKGRRLYIDDYQLDGVR